MPVLLIGASGLAREVIATGAVGPVGGILDDDPARAGSPFGGSRVLGPIELAADREDDLLICVGSGSARRAIVTRLEARGVHADRFALAVHPSTVLGSDVTVGPGSVLLPGSVVTADARIGAHVVVMPNCTVTHDDQLGDYATLAAGVALGGSVRIGSAAYLGMNSSIRQGVSVGEDATIGMGAAVLRDVPPGETWAGVPARPLTGARS